MKVFLVTALVLLLAGCREQESNHKPPVVYSSRNDSPALQREQPNPYALIDRSPMDVTYFPEDYPVLKMTGKISTPLARVIYSRPHRAGRKIFGDLVPFGEPWRLGANEATEIELFQPAQIQGKTVPKGRYTLYCIPQASQWTVVFNKSNFTWGLKPDQAQDAYRFSIPAEQTPVSIEYFTIVFQKADQGAQLLMAWDTVQAKLPMSFQ